MNVPPLIVLAYVLLALAIGFIGRKRAAGFAGNFVLSLLLTPVVMALALMLGTPNRSQAR